MGVKRQRDWVVAHDATQGDKAYALECLRCGVVQKVALPISIDCYLALGGAFAKEHSRCRPRIIHAGAGSAG